MSTGKSPRIANRKKFFGCDNCGTRTLIEDIIITEDDGWLCPDCAEIEGLSTEATPNISE